MLRQLRHDQRRLATLGAAALDGFDMHQTRGMKIFEIFSKAKRAERREKLKEEMQRGYFDDFRDFRDSKGKVFQAPQRLIPASAAPIFPSIEPLAADGTPHPFPSVGPDAPAASLVCVAFRAGAQEMLEAWAKPFSVAHQESPNVALYELALIESVVMGVWPFRSILMKNGVASQGKYAMPATYLYYFKDSKPLRTALHMTNLLTGYVYLLDSQGRVRWRGSGSPDATEIQLLLKFSNQLIEDSTQEPKE